MSFSQRPSQPQFPETHPLAMVSRSPCFNATLNPTPQLLQLSPAPPPKSEGGPAAMRRTPGLDGGIQGLGFHYYRLSWNPQRATSHLCISVSPSVNKGEFGQMLRSKVGHNMQILC